MTTVIDSQREFSVPAYLEVSVILGKINSSMTSHDLRVQGTPITQFLLKRLIYWLDLE